MSVQLLSQDYISKVKPEQVKQWVSEGKVIKKGNQYYVAGNNVSWFQESCYVKDSDNNVKTYMVNPKGTIVEMTGTEQKGETVGEPTTTYSVATENIIERMGLTDENVKAEFKTFLSQQNGITVDEEGNISFADPKSLNDALKVFAEQHKENFVDPKAQKYVQFTNDSDKGVIDKLGNEGVIETNATDGKYKVKDENRLNTVLTVQEGDITYNEGDKKSAAVNAGVTTTTTQKVNEVDIPTDVPLRESRKNRKAVEKDAQEAYSKLVADADTETRDAIDLYIAENKYHDKIEKKMKELSEYTTTMGGTKTKKVQRDGADIIQYYINNYADEDKKESINNLVNQVQESQNVNDQAEVLKALEANKVLGIKFSSAELASLSEDKKAEYINNAFKSLDSGTAHKGALLSVAKACGLEPNSLLRLMATYDVMKNRSSEQAISDDQYFIKHQAKDFVKHQQVAQDVPDTNVYFSKKDRKAADDNGKINNDIGNKGRALVKACPDMLCDDASNDNDFKEGENGYFTSEDGKKYKFSQDKWKTFMQICCDPQTATDAEMTVLFGDDQTKKSNFMKDLNMTLNEGRSVLDMNLPSPYGETGTMKFVNIIGNNNDNIGNGELNTLRDLVQTAGYSVDKNTTAAKRALHVAKNIGLGVGAGLLTGGMGSLLAGAVNIAGTTAGQVVGYSGTTDPTTISNKTTFTYTVDGEEYQRSVTSNITVPGQDYSGQVDVDGQDYSDKGNNHLRTAGNAGILGGIAGATRGLSTMGGVNANGRNTDDLFSLTRLVQEQETESKDLSLEIPQYTTSVTRSGQVEVETEIPKLKAVRYRGPAAYSGLYRYEDGTPVNPRDFAKAYQTKVGGKMTDYNFFVFPELEINGKKIVPKENYEAEYQKITPGQRGGTRGVTYSGNDKRTLHAKGTIST
jgi:hypothetical protein